MGVSALPRMPVAPVRRRGARALGQSSDADLVAQVREGDPRAFELLYDRHHRGLLAFCRHMLGSCEEAEDAVQQVFLSAFGQLRDATPPAALAPWLYAVARNRCLSMLRARREHADADDHPAATEGLAEAVQRRADLRALLGDLAALAEDQRAALVLAELGDLSHPEIAQVLACPAPKVKALVFQAREALIGARRAREADCTEIRETLATATGGALRRGPLRRHLAVCAGCRAFRDEVATQRRALALVLPVVPTLALRHAVLGGGDGAAAATAATAGGGLGALGSGLGAKVGVVLALAAGGVGAVAGVRALEHRGDRSPAAAPVVRPASAHATPVVPSAFGVVTGPLHGEKAGHHHRARKHAPPHAKRAHHRAPPAAVPAPRHALVTTPARKPVVAPSTHRTPVRPRAPARHPQPVPPASKATTRTVAPDPPAPVAPAPQPVAPAPTVEHGHGHGHGHGHAYGHLPGHGHGSHHGGGE